MALIKFGNHILKNSTNTVFLGTETSPLEHYDFNDIQDIYKTLKEGDKVAFFIRHGERPTNDWSKTAPLTENGIQQCLTAGGKIRGGAADKNQIEAHSTDTRRTQETAFYIATGRGDDLWQNYSQVPITDSISGDIYYAPGYTSERYEIISAFAYKEMAEYAPGYESHFNDLDWTTHLILENILGQLRNSDKPILLFTSHDSAVLPFTVACADGKMDCLKFHVNGQWINFVAGTAIILRANGSTETYPVKGIDSGWMRP